MTDWFYAFFMAWGMFLAIPCPWPRWREEARGKMLVCLPLVGLIPGALWAGLVWVLARTSLPAPLASLLVAALPWLATGFLHLDGFMDVCDAILSRRDLATRQKILKDSHCGAFSVICVVLLALTQWAVCQSAPLDELPLLPLALIPVATRASAALAVLRLPPLAGSQYAAQSAPPRAHVLALSSAAICAAVLPLIFCGVHGFAPVAAALFYRCFCRCARRDLGGMSGDISGFSLTLGELGGLVVLFLVR